jgi:UrcA family protein
MNKLLLGIGIGMAVSISAGSIAVAQDVQEIVVTARGDVAVKQAGRSATAVPIVDMSISYGVSYAGLDLASAVGAAKLETRVHEAAKEGCKDISAKRPFQEFTTSEADCVKSAADKAMLKVHELVGEAAKKSAK